MKLKKSVDTSQCDFCGQGSYYECLGCGKDMCFDCIKTKGKQFNHAVFFHGSYDGHFCNACLANPPKNCIEILGAYLEIERLRREYDDFHAGLDNRSKEAEQRLRLLIKK